MTTQINTLCATHARADYKDYLTQLTLHFVDRLFPKSAKKTIMDMPLVGPNGLRQQLGELSLEYFARAYFPEYFIKPLGEFHIAAYEELTKILAKPPSRRRLARGWPRGFAKSTIFNFFTPTNAMVYGKRGFILQASDTESQATSFLADIKNSLDGNPHIFQDFGDVKGNVWRSDMVAVKNANGVSYVAAIGAESSARGIRQAQFRPQLITLDDLENDESVQTLDRIEKRYKWLTRTLIPIGDETTDIIYVGTVLAESCVFDRVLNDPAWDAQKYSAIKRWSDSPLWDEWKRLYTDLTVSKEERSKQAREFYEANKEELLRDTEVLWPEGKSYLDLMEMYIDIGDLAFQAEMQNTPINPQDCIFKRDWFSYYDPEVTLNRVKIVEYAGAVDPSLGKSKLGDYTAIITLGRGSDGFIYVIDALIERMPPDRIIDTILQKAKQYRYTRFGIEVNQFQDLLRLELLREATRRNIYLPVTEMRHNKDKVIRVQSLVPYVKNRYLRFNRNHTLLLDQLYNFPKGRYDDGPDALEMAVRLLNTGPSISAMEGGVDSSYSRRTFDDDDDNVRSYGLSWTDF